MNYLKEYIQTEYDADHKKAQDVYAVQKKFVEDFPVNKIMDLTLDEYLIAKEGFGNKDSFCHRIRYDLDCLATMGNVYFKAFEIYLNHGTEITLSPRLEKRFGNDFEAAFAYVKSSIVDLLESAIRGDDKAIEESKLNASFKYRLLMTYLPDAIFPVCTTGTLNGYCASIGMSINEKEEMIYRNRALVAWKNKVPEMKTWNNYEVMRFVNWLWRRKIVINGMDYTKRPGMNGKVVVFNSFRKVEESKEYKPALFITKKKIYRLFDWHEALKVIMYSKCFKSDRMDYIADQINLPNLLFNNLVLITDNGEENEEFAKFSPDCYIRVFSSGKENVQLLHEIRQWLGDFQLFLFQYESEEDLANADAAITKKENALIEEKGYKRGSTKHLIAHINGKVLSGSEKLFRRIETDFDNALFLGDIKITEDEELILKQFMSAQLSNISAGYQEVAHPKVFAFGLVRVALKYYASKTFWPYIYEEYGVIALGQAQSTINMLYRDILKNSGKLYYENSSGFIQNYCMHAFICNKCADQLFDYVFEFWKIDLSRSLENSVDDNGNDIFNILIEEIGNNDLKSVQDVMIHTTMALKLNPRGCKNRFRRILKMIDDSFWNDADYSGSKNRITMLFNEWKAKSSSAFAKEKTRAAKYREGGRGEKLLSRPVLYWGKKNKLQLYLPKQILRYCTEDEHPVWTIRVNNMYFGSVEPDLIRGKSALFTNESYSALTTQALFEEIEITLSSEVREYYKRVIKSSDVRFFNAKHRGLDIIDDTISHDLKYICLKKNAKLKYVNLAPPSLIETFQAFNRYEINAKQGDIIILPDNHVVSVGRIIKEGIIGNGIVKGVNAVVDNEIFDISSEKEQVFFKASRTAYNGTSIKVIKNGKQTYFGKAPESDCLEFKLAETGGDIFGYFLQLASYIDDSGLYEIEISIPGGTVRQYRLCYIRGFKYSYVNAPYIFRESGTISFPSYLSVETSSEWDINQGEKRLTFSFDETDKNTDKHVKNRKLELSYRLKEKSILLSLDLPVLYWKYKSTDEWTYKKPEDLSIKSVPNYVYLTGAFDLSSAKVEIENSEDLDDSDIPLMFDNKLDCYYIRGVDIKSLLNRDRKLRYVRMRVEGRSFRLLTIVCRSIVLSQTITGDFENQRIYGHFDIFGSSEYMVTIKYKGETVEEDIPVIDGQFQVECSVHSGEYTVYLYELEEDDSGFGSVSYELGKYSLMLVDVRHLENMQLKIVKVKYRNNTIAALKVRNDYRIKLFKRLDYYKEVSNCYDIYSWMYDFTDENTVSDFVYYAGVIGEYTKTKGFMPMKKALIIFDNPQNMNELLINVLDNEYGNALIYQNNVKRLCVSDDRLRREDKRYANLLDDDLYIINVEIGG